MPRRISRELKTLSVWALSLAISGCIGTGGIAPQGQSLNASDLATDEAIQSAAQDAHWPTAQWWQAYGDPQLNRWVDLATQHSPSLAMAAARVREARAMAGIAEAAESLQINSDTTLKRHNWPKDQFYGPGELSGANTWDNNASLGLSYALDLWGRESNTTERAVDLAHMSAAEARQAQLELQNNVVRAYIQLSLQYANRDIVAATLAQQQQILDLANKRLNAGIGTHFDVSQAETPLPETHRQLDALDEEIALSRNQLAALAGKGPGEGAKLQRPTLSLAAPLKLPSRLPAQLLGQRPDVVASRWQVAAQARGIEGHVALALEAALRVPVGLAVPDEIHRHARRPFMAGRGAFPERPRPRVVVARKVAPCVTGIGTPLSRKGGALVRCPRHRLNIV